MSVNLMNLVHLRFYIELKLLHCMDQGTEKLKGVSEITTEPWKTVNGRKVQQQNLHNIVVLSSALMEVISICCRGCQDFHRIIYSQLTRYQYPWWGSLSEATKMVMIHDEKNMKTSSTERTPYGEAVLGKQSWANTKENTSITWWQATSTSIPSFSSQWSDKWKVWLSLKWNVRIQSVASGGAVNDVKLHMATPWTLGCWHFQVIFFWTFAGTLLFHKIGWGCPLNAAGASSHEKLLHPLSPLV